MLNKMINFLTGSEIIWLLFYLLLLAIIKLTNSPSESMNNMWINVSYIYPFILIPLTFAIYYFDPSPRSFLLIRIWLAAIIGGHFLIEKALDSHTTQGPGVGTAYIMGMIYGLIILSLLSVVKLLKFI